MKKTRKFIALIVGLISATSALQAATPRHLIDWGPYVGGGVSSSNAQVRYSSGMIGSYSYAWRMANGVYLGPSLEVADGFYVMKDNEESRKLISSYDNFQVGLGGKLGRVFYPDNPLSREVYLSAVAGQGFSKLQVDESGEGYFTQTSYKHLSGNYFALQTGMRIPLKENFALTLSLLTSLYEVDQSRAKGKFDSEQQTKTGVVYLSGPVESAASMLTDVIYLRTAAGMMSLSLNF